MTIEKKESKYILTLLLCYFLGIFGVHRLINGKTGTGIAMILTCGGCGIWVLIDLIIILSGNFKNIDGEVIKTEKPFFENIANIIVVAFCALGIVYSIFNAVATTAIIGGAF